MPSAQAIEYAVHPNINAALVVLYDGIIVEIFDQEVSVTEPILHEGSVSTRVAALESSGSGASGSQCGLRYR
jgi:hypothetical protein